MNPKTTVRHYIINEKELLEKLGISPSKEKLCSIVRDSPDPNTVKITTQQENERNYND